MIKFVKRPDIAGQPAYLAKVAGHPEALASLEREDMSATGQNMWGSRYRWIVKYPTGAKWDYTDTLSEAKQIVGARIVEAMTE